MADKPIIKIGVDDSAFNKFKALYDQYVASVKSQPGAWRLISEEQGNAWTKYEKMLRGIGQMPEHQRGLIQGLREQDKLLTNSERMWVSVTNKTKEFAEHIKGATESLLRWTGILTVVGGVFDALSIFGIMRMAGQVSAERKSSTGLGVTIGQQKAFSANYGRIFGDPNSYLNYIQEMETDERKQKPFWALLHRGATHDTMADALALMDAARSQLLANKGNKELWGPLMQGMGMNLSAQEMQSMVSSGPDEWRGMRENFTKNATALDIPDKIAERWDNFNRTMEEARDRIHKTFVLALSPLEGPLEKLAGSFTHLVEVIANSGVVQHYLGEFAKWLTTEADQFDKKEFYESVDKFMSSVGEMATFVNNVFHPVDAVRQSMVDTINESMKREKFNLSDEQLRNLSFASVYGEVAGLPKGLLPAEMWGESGALPGKLGPGEHPAIGFMQIKPEIVDALNKQYHKHWDAHNLQDSMEMATILNKERIKKYKGFPDEDRMMAILASYAMGYGGDEGLDQLINNPKYGHDWQKWITDPSITPGFRANLEQRLRIELAIEQNPGSDIAVAVNDIVGAGMSLYKGANAGGL